MEEVSVGESWKNDSDAGKVEDGCLYSLPMTLCQGWSGWNKRDHEIPTCRHQSTQLTLVTVSSDRSPISQRKEQRGGGEEEMMKPSSAGRRRSINHQ